MSVPFTTYVILAGLQGIPRELYEAARVDGAGPWRTYRSIVLPLLRPALLVAVVLNVIYVFNSFPIIWIMTQGGPGRETDTTVTLVYKLAFKDHAIDEAAALSVLNVVALLVIVGVYVAVVGRRSREVQAVSRAACRRRCWSSPARSRPLFFLFPYLVMLLTALKPDSELVTIPPRLFPQRLDAGATSSTCGASRRSPGT